MSDTTTAQRYFVITAQSSASDWGRTLFLGFGKSEKDAWEDATGQTFWKKPDWDCRECDADFYGSKGTAGEMLSFTATPAVYDTDLTPIDQMARRWGRW